MAESANEIVLAESGYVGIDATIERFAAHTAAACVTAVEEDPYNFQPTYRDRSIFLLQRLKILVAHGRNWRVDQVRDFISASGFVPDQIMSQSHRVSVTDLF